MSKHQGLSRYRSAPKQAKIVGMENFWLLKRNTTDAKLGGVCVGIAERWHVDPILVRAAMVLLALSQGVGLVVYVAAWLLLPADDSQVPLIQQVLPKTAMIKPKAWLILILLATIIFMSTIGSGLPFGIWPGLIVTVLIMIGNRRHKNRSMQSHRSIPQVSRPDYRGMPLPPATAANWTTVPTPYPYPTPAPTQSMGLVAAGASEQPELARGQGQAAVPQPVFEQPPFLPQPIQHPTATVTTTSIPEPPSLGIDQSALPATKKPKRIRHKGLRRTAILTFVILAVAELCLAWLDHMTSRQIPARAYAATAAIICGAGLIVAARFGRSFILLLAGSLAALCTFGVIDVSDHPSIIHVYDATNPAPNRISLGSGKSTLDLRAVSSETESITIDAELGKTVVYLPRDRPVLLSWKVGVGKLSLSSGGGTAGLDTSGSWKKDGVGSPLSLQINQEVGQVLVIE